MSARTRVRALVLLAAATIVFVAVFFYWSIAPTFAPVAEARPTRILARDGSLLYEVRAADEETAAPVPLDELPASLKQAVLSAEDKRFYRHGGIDLLALGRAVLDDVTTGHAASGGSTIDEQLVKNVYFADAPRSVLEKARELVAASYWSLTHTKDQTLERYLNTVYLGNNVFGMPAAAEQYFHKDVRDLSVPESAMLAGIIGAPGRYEPAQHLSAARARQTFVLEQMVANRFLTTDEATTDAALSLSVFTPKHTLLAPHFVFRVLGLLEQSYPDIATGGYEITTTLDPNLQQVAEDSVTRQLAKLSQQHVTDASVMAVDPKTGEVLAYVGSVNYWSTDASGAVNMADALRQPGSALKPFMYQSAIMEKIVTPGTVIPDLPVRFALSSDDPESTGVYIPRNYSYHYHGPVSVRDALGSSLNIPAVVVLNQLGLNTFFDTLRRFGITFPEAPSHYGLSIVLGGGEVTLEEATEAYATLANGNASVPVSFVRQIRQGDAVVYQSKTPEPTNIFDAKDQTAANQATYLITDILSDKTARSISFGEVSAMDIGKPVAAKTGTTKDFRDNWAFGYTPDFVVGVWAGNADNSPMYAVSGISGAVPIWHDLMAYRYRYADPTPVPQVAGIVSKDICVTSGELATASCPKTREEKFIQGTEPTQPDTWYQSVAIDARSGNVATARCATNVVHKIFLVPPPQYNAWLAAAGVEQVPSVDCEGDPTPSALSTVPEILSPLDGDAIEIDPSIAQSSQTIPFISSATCLPTCTWVLNGSTIQTKNSTYLWSPVPGSYTLELKGSDGLVHFDVQ